MNPKNPTFDPARRKFIGSCCSAVGATGAYASSPSLSLRIVIIIKQNTI
jgi:hypothetical protein